MSPTVLKTALAIDSEVYVFDVKKPGYLVSLLERNANVSFTEINALDEKALEVVASSYKQQFDGLILTVGVSAPKTAFEDFRSFIRTVNINFLGNIIPIRVFLRNRLFKTPAKIIVIASTSGHFAGVSPNAYAPSKWMLVNACQSIRAELEEQGITLDLINPRTIKNVRSDEFKSDIGIDVSTVVGTAVGALARGYSKNYFIPSRYSLFHVIERLSPWLFDLAVHIPPDFIRKRQYKKLENDKSNRYVALITGASSGLGRELTRLLADQYTRIYVTARSLEDLNRLKDELADKCEIIPIQVDFEDVSAIENIKQIIKHTIGDTEKLDLLINNAGHHVKGSLLSVDLGTIEKTMQVNLFSPVALMVAFQDTPTIVNVLSTTAVYGRKNLGVYSSTKAGLWCFSKALRRTVGKTKNIIDVIPATFKSSLAAKGDKAIEASDILRSSIGSVKNNRLSSSNAGLTAYDVAKMIKAGIEKKRDVIYIPKVKTRMFIILEAIAPNVFKKLVK